MNKPYTAHYSLLTTHNAASMPDLEKDFEAFVVRHNLFSKNDGLLVACSGGLDSIVLCDLLHRKGYRFAIAHCNFQLRGQESERDEAFVRSIAEAYGVGSFFEAFETERIATERRQSIQVAARALRYAWFYSLLDERYPLLLTAHHADDNMETVLMNFFKGTGISGLHGILPKKDKTVRPLLFARKEALLQYAKEQHLGWVEDSSNASDKYTRNFFRHQVLPLVEQAIPNAAGNLLANIERMKEVEIVYTQSMAQQKQKLLEYKGNEVHIPVLKLAKTQPLNSIVYEIIKEFGFSSHQVPDAVALLQAETGRYLASSTHRLIKNRNWLILASIQSTEAMNILIEEKEVFVAFEEGGLAINRLAEGEHLSISNDNRIACLDIKQVKFPLLLRKWKAGDYFYPLGMPKKKKIARFLIDQKVSKTGKEKIWVIESDKKILWVIGYRIDDRFKITASTKKILKLAWK